MIHTTPESGGNWLLLVYQLPTRPSRARVHVWRRLHEIGAIAVKNSAYVLPNSSQSHEDFEWMRNEIIGLKGQATVFDARSVEAATDEEIFNGFREARRQ